MKIILQPCASPSAQTHLNNTIYNNDLNLQKIRPYLDNEEYNTLMQMYGENPIRVWGVKASSKTKWEKTKMGDVVLLAAKNRMFMMATLTYKIENHELAEYLWSSDEDEDTWDYIYFLDELININITYENFNKIVGYSPKKPMRGFSVLSEERSLSFLNLFDVESNRYIDDTITDFEYKKMISNLNTPSFNQGLNIEQKTYRRTEQGFLRKKLFGNNFTDKCAICGRELPIEFLWCAHIKKRSLCTIEELMDFDNIVTPMCKLGCDDLFEKGYLGVKDGIVTIIKYANNDTLDSYMNLINGKKCKTFKHGNKKYFDYHIENNKSR